MNEYVYDVPIVGMTISDGLLRNYFTALVNSFFKILPIREDLDEAGIECGEDSPLGVYMRSLQVELLGCKELISLLNEDSRFLSLLSILQYLIDHPCCSVKTVKREVFKAINICNLLKVKYTKAV